MMDKEEYEIYLHQCWLLVTVTRGIPIDKMIAAINKADSIGAIVDPTLYREKHRAMSEDREMLSALNNVRMIADPSLYRNKK